MKKLSAALAFCLMAPLLSSAKVPEIPRDTSFTTYSTDRKIRKYHPEATLAQPALPAGVREYRDVVYSTLPKTPYGRRDLHVDIFRPDDDKTYPALLMIHGGGWNSGSPTSFDFVGQRVAQAGYRFVSLGYRLSPFNKYPCQIEDVCAGYNAAMTFLERKGIDISKVIVSGPSAGAHLASILCYSRKVQECAEIDASHIAGFIGVGGAIQFFRQTDTCRENAAASVV